MTEQNEAESGNYWKRFIRKHWAIFIVFVVAAILAIVGGLVVFLWFVGNAQSTGLVPSVLSLWTMNNVVLFILNAIFWELILIGIPIAIGALIGWLWWKRLPWEEKKGDKSRSRSRDSSGGFSLLLFIAFAIKVYVDGNWNTAISTFTVNYVVNSVIMILVWIAAIFAIPAIVGLVWWIYHDENKKS